MLATAYLLVYLACGVAVARFQFPRRRPVERAWLGLCLGVVLLMWMPALLAYIPVVRFSRLGHALALAPLAAVTAAAWALRDRRPVRRMEEDDAQLLITALIVAVPLTLLGAYLQHTHVLRQAADGSLYGGQATYGDLCLHLGIITSLRDAAFPPTYSILPGATLSYPYLTDSMSTSMLLLGMDLRMAVIVPGTLMMFLVFFGFVLLCREGVGNRRGVLILAAALFFLNGGFGFLYDVDMALRDPSNFLEIFTGWYKTPANQPEFNLRWSNIIVDMLLPQRTLLGGWTALLPALLLLQWAAKDRSRRAFAVLGILAGAMPLVHTHSFLALGLFSAGYLIAMLLRARGERDGLRLLFTGAALYFAITLALALPQLVGNAFKQTLEGGSLRVQFNWVNNSQNQGLIDEYFFFWIKNVGPAFVLLLCVLLDGRRRGHGPLIAGALSIFAVAELVLFQPNEYDNNKLFYVFYMFGAMLAADYASVLMLRLKGLRGRYLLAALFVGCSVLSGSLSIAREAVSNYQLFDAGAVQAARFVEEETEPHAVFMTGTQHLNPVAALAGRNIVCGSDLYLYFHGLNYQQNARDVQRFYQDPAGNLDVLEQYGVSYIYLSDYERAEQNADEAALDALFPKVYEAGRITIYAVGE